VEEKHHNTSKSHTKKKHLHHKGKGHKKAKKSDTPAQSTLLMLDTDQKQKVDQTIAEKVNQQVNQKVHQKA
jgi:hypothetical protein